VVYYEPNFKLNLIIVHTGVFPRSPWIMSMKFLPSLIYPGFKCTGNKLALAFGYSLEKMLIILSTQTMWKVRSFNSVLYHNVPNLVFSCKLWKSNSSIILFWLLDIRPRIVTLGYISRRRPLFRSTGPHWSFKSTYSGAETQLGTPDSRTTATILISPP
jgi:hypothetical protein